MTLKEFLYYLSDAKEHYSISDDFVKSGYGQKKGGYIEYAIETGHLVDFNFAEPNQKWHFIESYLFLSLNGAGNRAWNSEWQWDIRKDKGRQLCEDANLFYNNTNFRCKELLLWLAEACRVNSSIIIKAKNMFIDDINSNVDSRDSAKKFKDLIPFELLKESMKKNFNNIQQN